MPGWDEWITEVVRKFAHHGFSSVSPHLYFRDGPGNPDDIGARVRAAGGVPDDQVVGDVKGAMAFLRAQQNHNGKVGVIGFCSGGRHAYLCACRIPDLDAVVDCWGGNVVVDDKSQLNAKRPIAPIDLTEQLRCPLLGLFGNDDQNPNADQVNRTEATAPAARQELRIPPLRRRGARFLQHHAHRLSGRAGGRRVGKGLCVPATAPCRVSVQSTPQSNPKR